jgi:hypothetical protein
MGVGEVFKSCTDKDQDQDQDIRGLLLFVTHLPDFPITTGTGGIS